VHPVLAAAIPRSYDTNLVTTAAVVAGINGDGRWPEAEGPHRTTALVRLEDWIPAKVQRPTRWHNRAWPPAPKSFSGRPLYM
jgi:hypothetical protein